ncbi:MAG: FdtA/QdtA family cupin domain-containing protein [Bacteroidales bacterium]|nr:FdtA/QdtA family cupin domain-containing protein [Bacteroidales bacterium]
MLNGGEQPHAVTDTAKAWDYDFNRRNSLDDCRIVELSRICHPNGSLTVVDNSDNLFPIKRVFYLYDVPGDSERGGHSHFRAHEFIIAASGSFDVTLTDGVDERKFSLNRPYKALYIPNGIWRSLDNFSSGSVSLVLTSELYSEDDYCRSMRRFKEIYVEG